MNTNALVTKKPLLKQAALNLIFLQRSVYFKQLFIPWKYYAALDEIRFKRLLCKVMSQRLNIYLSYGSFYKLPFNTT